MEMQKDSGEQEVGTYVRKAYEASLVKRILQGLLWASLKTSWDLHFWEDRGGFSLSLLLSTTENAGHYI